MTRNVPVLTSLSLTTVQPFCERLVANLPPSLSSPENELGSYTSTRATHWCFM